MLFFGLFEINVLYFLFLLVLLLYWYSDYKARNYWINRGVHQQKLLPLISGIYGFYTLFRDGLRKAALKGVKDHGKVYGTYFMGAQILVVTDPEMLKQILIKNAYQFIDRFSVGAETRPLRDGILNLKGEEWRRVRNILSPTFSSGKLKAMMPLLRETIATFRDVVGEDCDAGKEVNMLERAGAFTMESSAKIMFAMDSRAQRDPEDAFLRNGKMAVQVTIESPLVAITLLFPFVRPFIKYFNVSLFPRGVAEFFNGAVSRAVQERKRSGTSAMYHDLLALMMRAHEESDSDHKALTEDELLAQAFICFLAGYETTANTFGMMMYFLATHPAAQLRAYEEVCQVLGDNEVTYDAAQKLHYLGNCLEETLRLNPPAPILNRQATEDTLISDIPISKGTVINIPVIALHLDPQYFEDPFSFKPERYEENPELTKSITWLPFGAGPRNCIGMRLAQLEIKMAMAELLRNFQFKLAEGLPTNYFDIKMSANPAKPAADILFDVVRRN